MTASSVTCPTCTENLGQAETSEEAAALQRAHVCQGGGNPKQDPSPPQRS